MIFIVSDEIEAMAKYDTNYAIQELDESNASSVFKKDKNLAKGFINRLVRKFKDSVIRERIKMRRQGWSKGQLGDIKLFRNEVGKIALDLELTDTARMRAGVTRKHADTS